MDKSMMQFEARRKSSGVGYLLWFFFGLLGMHRFYAGRIKSAVLQLLLGIGAIVLATIGFMAGMGAGLQGEEEAAQGILGFSMVALLVWLLVAVWVFIDLFFISGWITRHNVRLADELKD